MWITKLSGEDLSWVSGPIGMLIKSQCQKKAGLHTCQSKEQAPLGTLDSFQAAVIFATATAILHV